MVYQGDLHDYLDRKGKLDALTAVKFALDIAKYVTWCFHFPPVFGNAFQQLEVMFSAESAGRCRIVQSVEAKDQNEMILFCFQP